MNGTVEYQDDSEFQPLHISEVELLATNIRNIRSSERQYPSTLHAEGRIFDVGRAVVDGHADFLAEPSPGVKGSIDLQRVINTGENPPYRLFCSNADFELTNLSSRAEDGPAKATLRGNFMGSGAVDGNATFYPEGKQANFETKVEIKDTQLKSLNPLLRAKGKFDVTEGTMSLYTEVRVREGAIDWYVKPLFRDVKVYDSEQDKNKNPLRKAYEGIIGGLTKILENRKGEVATVASLKGPCPRGMYTPDLARELVRTGRLPSLVSVPLRRPSTRTSRERPRPAEWTPSR